MAEDRGFLDVFGHDEARERLRLAVQTGRLPQSLLLYGPRGVGKQRLAIWTAAALTCAGDSPRARPPCARCQPCRLNASLQHPDVNWFFPLPRPKRASGPEQLQRALEELRAAALEERRENPAYTDEEEGATGIYVAAVNTMRRLAHKTPAMGTVKALVIGRAEAMTPQTGSHEAANATLKLLEEPPDDTHLILTSDVPGALLPTIRSRLQAIRIGPLSEEQISEFLRSRLDRTPADARSLAARSGGSIGRALELIQTDDEGIQERAIELIGALLNGGREGRLRAAHAHRTAGTRTLFVRTLGEARRLLRDLLAVSGGAPDAVADARVVARLTSEAHPPPDAIIRAIEALGDAQELADRNVNPQLIVVGLLQDVASLRAP